MSASEWFLFVGAVVLATGTLMVVLAAGAEVIGLVIGAVVGLLIFASLLYRDMTKPNGATLSAEDVAVCRELKTSEARALCWDGVVMIAEKRRR